MYFHPLQEEIGNMSDEEISKRIKELSRKVAIARRGRNPELLLNLQQALNTYRDAIRQRRIEEWHKNNKKLRNEPDYATRDNIGNRLGVLFIEFKTRLKKVIDEEGVLELVPEPYVEKNIISLATVQAQLGKQFRITGLDSQNESSELALLLRAGALAAPMYIVEERTIGPSLGAENIALGIKSVIVGLLAVLIFMLLIYRVFGIFANFALASNLLLLMGIMSLLGATLTLPGIAGIVLTVGMAVDANVLIFSRIREELAGGLSPQRAITAGYDRAFVSILDANITTLIVALILYAIGSGPVQGFAVTLSIGIITSMFTSIVLTRGMVNLVYGNRKVERLWI